MHAAHHDVQPVEHLGRLVEGAVLEDVDLDAAQDAERRELLVQPVNQLDLLAQAVGAQAVRDREPGRVVGHRQVLVAELGRSPRHALDRRAAVGPVRVHVQVAAQP